jgi:hypothetical protein
MISEMARIAALVAIVQKRTGLGLTALMKLCYFLQTLRAVPLGYDFTLYSYGPFDSAVLSDLTTAESLGGVSSRVVQYSGGYGYEIEPTGRSRAVVGLAAGFIEKYREDINWVVEAFGGLRRADLEVLSTIVYVDRKSAEADELLSEDDLVHRVREVKPNFSEDFVAENVRRLIGMELLQAIV